MSVPQPVEPVLEKAPSKDWLNTNGIYADFKRWPYEVEYYVECPKCHQVHGSYKTLRGAHSQRLCPGCNIKAVDDIKKQVRQVIWEPEKKVRPLAAIVRESELDKLPPAGGLDLPEPPPPESDLANTFLGREPEDELERLTADQWTFIDWTIPALHDLAAELGYGAEDLEIDAGGAGDYDADNPGRREIARFEKDHGHEFEVRGIHYPRVPMTGTDKLTKDPGDLWETWGDSPFQEFLRPRLRLSNTEPFDAQSLR